MPRKGIGAPSLSTASRRPAGPGKTRFARVNLRALIRWAGAQVEVIPPLILPPWDGGITSGPGLPAILRIAMWTSFRGGEFELR